MLPFLYSWSTHSSGTYSTQTFVRWLLKIWTIYPMQWWLRRASTFYATKVCCMRVDCKLPPFRSFGNTIRRRYMARLICPANCANKCLLTLLNIYDRICDNKNYFISKSWKKHNWCCMLRGICNRLAHGLIFQIFPDSARIFENIVTRSKSSSHKWIVTSRFGNRFMFYCRVFRWVMADDDDEIKDVDDEQQLSHINEIIVRHRKEKKELQGW